jgi:hypothetical protein
MKTCLSRLRCWIFILDQHPNVIISAKFLDWRNWRKISPGHTSGLWSGFQTKVNKINIQFTNCCLLQYHSFTRSPFLAQFIFQWNCSTELVILSILNESLHREHSRNHTVSHVCTLSLFARHNPWGHVLASYVINVDERLTPCLLNKNINSVE